MKKDILIVADRPHWAYHNIVEFVYKQFSNEYNIYKDYLLFNLKIDNRSSVLKKQYRKIKYKYRELHKYKYSKIKTDNKYDLVIYLGFYFPLQMKNNYHYSKIIKGIYTEGFPPENTESFIKTEEEFIKKYLIDCDAIVCGNQNIREFYSKLFHRCYYANASHDELLFKRKNSKTINNSKKFIIGWSGNKNRPFKNYYNIILPVISKLKKIYPGIILKTRTKGSMNSLPGFYSDIDLVIIASEKDAGPSLFYEASLMDVPSISCKTGMPREIIKHKHNGYFVNNCCIDDFQNGIIEIYNDRKLLFSMSQNIRKDAINQLGTEISKKRWEIVLSEVLREQRIF